MDLPPHITEAMLNDALRRAERMARNYQLRWWMISSERDDLTSEAYLSVLESVQSWDPAGGMKWLNYVTGGIRNNLYHYSRKQYPFGKKLFTETKGSGRERVSRLDEPLPSGTARLVDCTPAQREQGWESRSDAAIIAREAMSLVSGRDRDILTLHYWGEKSQREVALLVGMTQPGVGKAIQRVLKELREQLCPTVT